VKASPTIRGALADLADSGRKRARLRDAAEIVARGRRRARARRRRAAAGGVAGVVLLGAGIGFLASSGTAGHDKPEPAPAALRPDVAAPGVVPDVTGLGVVAFGEPAEVALPRLTSALGAPDGDSGWRPVTTAFVGCPGTLVRTARWDGLTVYLSDGPTGFAPAGRRHVFAWELVAADGGIPFATRLGVRPGMTLEVVRRLHAGGEVVLEAGGPGFDTQVRLGPPGGPVLRASATGAQDAATLRWLSGGQGCGE